MRHAGLLGAEGLQLGAQFAVVIGQQRHRHRAEHWFVVAGQALVTLNGVDRTLGPGGSVDIEAGFSHRIMNPGSDNLVFVEVQTGEGFSEDDIERLEDDYGRIK